MADYMENGFLENIIDMFRHDRSLYGHLAGLMADERGRVRLGAVALIETLKDEHTEEIEGIIPGIASLLKNENPVIRADAVYLLGVIGHRDTIKHLSDALNDSHPAVRSAAEEELTALRETFKKSLP